MFPDKAWLFIKFVLLTSVILHVHDNNFFINIFVYDFDDFDFYLNCLDVPWSITIGSLSVDN